MSIIMIIDYYIVIYYTRRSMLPAEKRSHGRDAQEQALTFEAPYKTKTMEMVGKRIVYWPPFRRSIR